MKKNTNVPVFEKYPPHQKRYPHERGDFGVDSTSIPVCNPKINTLPNKEAEIMTNAQRAMSAPVIDKDGPAIFPSTTDGKGRK